MIKPTILLVLILSFLIFAAKIYFDTNTIEIRHYQIKNSPLAEVLKDLKVAHLSDLHIKSIGLMENKILEILKREKPDLVLITGDFIGFEGPYEPAISFFHQFKAPLGVYAVMGNTEYSNENGSCILCHKEKSRDLKENQSPVLLRNSMVFLKINEKVLQLIGVDDPVGNRSDLRKALKEGKQGVPSILLAHSPEIFEEGSGSGVDLILSGHTHGGQIFITRYLRKIFPLEPSLEFIDGFFQKGKTLMHVSRGIGTSFLPFRFGIKPEVTFFTFGKNTNNEKVRIARMDRIDQTNQAHRINTVSISNTPSYTVFSGLSISSVLGTFNLFDGIRNKFTSPDSDHSNILFDFESDSDLQGLNWECHKWFERSEAHVTSGKYSLKVLLPPGQYPGINFREVPKDWSKANLFKMDVFNPSQERFNFHVRIDDHKSGWEYADRFDADFNLKPGLNNISIPTNSIQTNFRHRSLNLKRIKGMMVFLTNNTRSRELYFDNIRLE
jgi:predicted MPP superfamily phosphohydrolase